MGTQEHTLQWSLLHTALPPRWTSLHTPFPCSRPLVEAARAAGACRPRGGGQQVLRLRHLGGQAVRQDLAGLPRGPPPHGRVRAGRPPPRGHSKGDPAGNCLRMPSAAPCLGHGTAMCRPKARSASWAAAQRPCLRPSSTSLAAPATFCRRRLGCRVFQEYGGDESIMADMRRLEHRTDVVLLVAALANTLSPRALADRGLDATKVPAKQCLQQPVSACQSQRQQCSAAGPQAWPLAPRPFATWLASCKLQGHMRGRGPGQASKGWGRVAAPGLAINLQTVHCGVYPLCCASSTSGRLFSGACLHAHRPRRRPAVNQLVWGADAAVGRALGSLQSGGGGDGSRNAFATLQALFLRADCHAAPPAPPRCTARSRCPCLPGTGWR